MPTKRVLRKKSAPKTLKNTGNKKIYKDTVYCFLQMLNTIKLYHWKTTDYPTHKATDQLYSDLNGKADEFVEVLLGKSDAAGKNRAMILNVKSINVRSFNNNNELKREIEKYKSFLISFTNNSLMKKQYNADLIAIRDEILALLNQFLYMLTLH
jgi:DNA-binding ferritin-like protein